MLQEDSKDFSSCPDLNILTNIFPITTKKMTIKPIAPTSTTIPMIQNKIQAIIYDGIATIANRTTDPMTKRIFPNKPGIGIFFSASFLALALSASSCSS